MTPNLSKLTVRNLQPTALTNVGYNKLMTLVTSCKEHFTRNELREGTQAGFTEGTWI